MNIVPLGSRRLWFRIVGGIATWLIVVGPWPARDDPPRSLGPDTSRFDRAVISPGIRGVGPIQIGLAKVDLVPPRPTPLAGHIGGVAIPFVAINSPCMAKALTIANSESRVTILTADLLLVDARLADAVLTRAGLPRDQVYFTATHTHGGPGGWGIHPLERLVAGTFDPAEFDRLADHLADAIQRSRIAMVPAEVGFVQVEVPGRQWNRIIPGGATNESLAAWAFRSPTPLPGRPGDRPMLATLAVFGAHATVAHPDPPRLGADYPGAFTNELARIADSGEVLFAAGSVGDAGPVRPPAPNEQLRAEAYGRSLAACVASSLGTVEFRGEIALAILGRQVDLPAIQVPVQLATLRLSPLVTWWIGRPQSHLHVIRLGPAVLVGFPGDYAGELARTIRADLPVVATSFAGDYKGYLVTAATYREHACYETRWMSFFGPYLGEHLTRIAEGMIGQLAAPL